jgi:hypothetical protein
VLVGWRYYVPDYSPIAVFGLLKGSVMKPLHSWILIVLASSPLWPLFAADDPDSATTKKEKDVYSGELVGKVTKISKRSKGFTLRVEYLELVPNSGGRGGSGAPSDLQALVRQQQEWADLQTGLQKSKSQVQRLAKLQHYSAKFDHRRMKSHAQHLPYHLAVRHESIDLQPAAEIELRVSEPPPIFDDQGKPQKYTAAELRDLKGPGKAWGYPANWSDLQKGQTIAVFLAKKKTRDTESEEGAKSSEVEHPLVAKIHILPDAKKP